MQITESLRKEILFLLLPKDSIHVLHVLRFIKEDQFSATVLKIPHCSSLNFGWENNNNYAFQCLKNSDVISMDTFLHLCTRWQCWRSFLCSFLQKCKDEYKTLLRLQERQYFLFKLNHFEL